MQTSRIGAILARTSPGEKTASGSPVECTRRDGERRLARWGSAMIARQPPADDAVIATFAPMFAPMEDAAA